MKKGPIGVWFSIALAILVFGLCIGWMLGARIAVYSYRFRQQRTGVLSRPEQAHIESVLSELSAFQWVQLSAVFASTFEEPRKKHLNDELAGLEALKSRSDAQEIRQVIDLETGLAHVDVAIAEERDNNKVAAAEHMKSAQTLFQALGWQDCSEETLQAVEKREFDKRNPDKVRAEADRELEIWKAKSQTREHAK